MLVTGAGGLLGSWLRRTAPSDAAITSLVHRTAVPDGPTVTADLRAADQVAAAFDAARPDLVIHAAMAVDEASIVTATRHVDVMPEVCWQVPLRRVDETDDLGHVTSTVREWKRRDWGDGGHDFHWWCTDGDEAFVGTVPVFEEMGAELAQMVGEDIYQLIAEHLRNRLRLRGTEVFLPHPAVRRG